jgi:hypothetical protein
VSFEATLGCHYLAVTVRNTWSIGWPAQAVLGLTDRCRSWLATAGIVVVDGWSPADQAAVDQEVVGGRVRVGGLAAGGSRVVYFKVDVAGGRPGKHNVEVEVTEPLMPDADSPNRRALGSMFVSRTTFDPTDSVFVSQCDRGRLVAAIRELTVDYHTFKRAVGRARRLFRDGERPPGGTGGGGDARLTPAEVEDLRARLRAFLAGGDVDLCDLLRRLQCACAGSGRPGGGSGPGGGTGPGGPGREPGGGGEDDDWAGGGVTGLEFVAIPTRVDYRVEYGAAWEGQFGPIPFDDPWWKILLAIIALILTLGAALSAAADLANGSDDVSIGRVTRALLNPFATAEEAAAARDADPAAGTVDAAVATLNGNRSLTPAIFSYKDAAGDEANTVPQVALGGRIDTAGGSLSNEQLTGLLDDLAANPDDPDAGRGCGCSSRGPAPA